MIFLKIKQPGHVIHLRGLQPVRTPVTIDITNYDMEYLQTELRKQGLTGYEIKYSSEEQKQKIPIYTEKFTIIDTTEKLDEISDKLNSLESLIQKLVQQEPSFYKDSAKSEIQKVDPEQDIDFIPSVDTTVVLSKELTTVKVKKEDIIEENLKNIPKGFFKKSNSLD